LEGLADSGAVKLRSRAHLILKGALLGIVDAAIVSALLSFGAALLYGFDRHPFELVPWLLAVSVLPAGSGGVLLAVVPKRAAASLGRALTLSAIVAFLAVAASGSIGAVLVESLDRPWNEINASGYFRSCWDYAFSLLPLTTPLVFATAWILWRENA